MPALWRLEVASVIVRAVSKGLLVEAQSAEFLGVLQDMAISVDMETAEHSLNDTLQLARCFKFSSYDTSYLELALRAGLPLATLDKDLRAALAATGAKLAA